MQSASLLLISIGLLSLVARTIKAWVTTVQLVCCSYGARRRGRHEAVPDPQRWLGVARNPRRRQARRWGHRMDMLEANSQCTYF